MNHLRSFLQQITAKKNADVEEINGTREIEVIQYIMDIVIRVGTWDFWPNYHHSQYITISNMAL